MLLPPWQSYEATKCSFLNSALMATTMRIKTFKQTLMHCLPSPARPKTKSVFATLKNLPSRGEPRLVILQTHGRLTQQDSFEHTHSTEHQTLTRLTQESATTFDEFIKITDALVERMRDNNITTIEKHELFLKIALSIIGLIFVIAFIVIPRSIQASVSKAKMACEQIQATKNLSTVIDTGTHDEIADAMLFLCSAQAGYITGQIINVDGGFSGW